MKISAKAALLSGLVFPGVGQLYLKLYWRGAIIMFFVLSGLGIIIGIATARALEILERIQSQSGTVDMATISKLAIASSTDHTSFYYRVSFLFIACCWLFSVIDAYMNGKKKEIS